MCVRACVCVCGDFPAANFARDHLYTKMEAVRTSADKLERIVDRDLWKLPTYEDMLFHTRIH